MIKQILLLFIVLLITLNSFSQIGTDTLSANQIPETILYKGNFIKAIKWKDKLGENYLIISETDVIKSRIAKELIKTTEIDYISKKGDTLYNDIRTELKDKEIWGVNYVIQNDSIIKLWEIYDFIKECYGSLKLDFVEPPIVTDIDNNGIFQTWLIYKMNCSSDVSPSKMKILMHIGNEKYAIRGTTQVSLNNKIDIEEYKMKFDSNFKKTSKSIIDFANDLWSKHVVENY